VFGLALILTAPLWLPPFARWFGNEVGDAFKDAVTTTTTQPVVTTLPAPPAP
jgi:hypothetical protein